MSNDYKKVEAGNSWDPDVQKEVEGVLTSVKGEVGKFNSTVATLNTNGEEVTVWCNKLLADKIEKVPVGSQVKVVFLGMKESKNFPNPYRDYDVFWKEAPMKKVESESVPF